MRDWPQNVICLTPTTTPPTTSSTATLPPIISIKETTKQTPSTEELTNTEEITAFEEETTEESTTADSQSTQTTTTTIRTTKLQQENQCSGANYLRRIDDCTKIKFCISASTQPKPDSITRAPFRCPAPDGSFKHEVSTMFWQCSEYYCL